MLAVAQARTGLSAWVPSLDTLVLSIPANNPTGIVAAVASGIQMRSRSVVNSCKSKALS